MKMRYPSGVPLLWPVHEAAIGGDHRIIGAAVALQPVGCGADAGQVAGLKILDEDIGRPVGVSRHQVGGFARKSDIAAVPADREPPTAFRIPLRAIGRRTDPGGEAGLQILDEHV